MQVGVVGVWGRCSSTSGSLTASKQDWPLGALLYWLKKL